MEYTLGTFAFMFYGEKSHVCYSQGIAKLPTYLHPAPSTSTQLISASTQLSAIPSTLLEPKYRI